LNEEIKELSEIEEQYEKQLKLAGTMREFFSSITHSSKKYDDLLKELYK
jgi:hypothetical protein